WHRITAFGIGRGGHGVAHSLPFVGRERIVATTAPLIEQRHGLILGTSRRRITHRVTHVLFGRKVHELLVTRDGVIDTADLGDFLVVLFLVIIVPGRARILVEQIAGFLRQC